MRYNSWEKYPELTFRSDNTGVWRQKKLFGGYKTFSFNWMMDYANACVVFQCNGLGFAVFTNLAAMVGGESEIILLFLDPPMEGQAIYYKKA